MPDELMGWVKVDEPEARWPNSVLWVIREIVHNPKALPPPNNELIIFSFDLKDLNVIIGFLTSPIFIEKFGVDTRCLGGSGIYDPSSGTFRAWPTQTNG